MKKITYFLMGAGAVVAGFFAYALLSDSPRPSKETPQSPQDPPADPTPPRYSSQDYVAHRREFFQKRAAERAAAESTEKPSFTTSVADSAGILEASPMGLSDKNLYAYCDNNPVMRRDDGGMFWDTVFDVISLACSVVDVIKNPDDPWAWAGLAADVVSLAVPFATGGGTIVKAASKVDDVVDVARSVDKAADALDTATDIGKAVGKVDDAKKASKVIKNVCSASDSATKSFRTVTSTTAEVSEKIKRFTPDQDAVIQLAKEARKNGGLSRKEAYILWEWAEEYGFGSYKNFHAPRFDSYQGGKVFHMKIKGYHINIWD